MTRRDLIGQLQLETGARSADPVGHRGIAPVARLATLDVRKLRHAQPLDRGAERDPPGRLLPHLRNPRVVRMLGQGPLEGVGGAHPAAVPAEPFRGLQHEPREILGVAGQRARHWTFLLCPRLAAAGVRRLQPNPALFNRWYTSPRAAPTARSAGTGAAAPARNSCREKSLSAQRD